MEIHDDFATGGTLYHIGKKGFLSLRDDEIISLGSQNDPNWGRKYSPWDRLNQHHTESTASRHYRLEHQKKKTGDSLDFILNSTYDHAAHLFPNDYDILLQNETIADEMRATAASSDDVTPDRGNLMLVIGGVSERRSPHNVRLNLSSHHMSRTAGGYGRKVDGSFYAP